MSKIHLVERLIGGFIVIMEAINGNDQGQWFIVKKLVPRTFIEKILEAVKKKHLEEF